MSLESVIALFPSVVAQASRAFACRAHCGFDDALLRDSEGVVRCGGFKLWEGEELVLTMYLRLPIH